MSAAARLRIYEAIRNYNEKMDGEQGQGRQETVRLEVGKSKGGSGFLTVM